MVPCIQSERRGQVVKIAVCATVNERKGQDVFIDDIKLIPKSIQKKAKFIILGERTSKVFFKNLQQKAKGIKEIIWQDCIKNADEYHKFIDDIDVLCCPSREDPYPLVVIDAMMHGKPVVISDHVGQKDIIKNGKNGFVFPSEDVSALADILTHLIQEGVSKDLRKKSRAIFENRFDPDKWFDNFEKIMENVCKK